MPLSNTINTPTIFTGGDTKFWNRFGKSFVNSFKHFNPDKTIHVHIFDPTESDIKELELSSCNYSVEYVSQDEIDELVENARLALETPMEDQTHKWQLKPCIKYFDDIPDMHGKLLKLMRFTKFASTRFIRLSEMWTGQHPVLAYDMDTLCQGMVPFDKVFDNTDQGCLRVKGDRFVVGLVSFRNNSPMLKDWGDSLRASFETKKVHGFLDQDTFVGLSSKYLVTHIDRNYCDSTAKSVHSLVVTAKGAMKEQASFLNQVAKWN
jgi:hypothetical protein